MVRMSVPLVLGLLVASPSRADEGDWDDDDDDDCGNCGDDGDQDDDDQGDDDDDPGDDDDDHDDDDEVPPPGVCGDGTWGQIGQPGEGWVHVSALVGNDATADGSVAFPFLTVAAAVEAARNLAPGDERVVAVWPGTYDASLTFVEGDGWEDPVTLVGCHREESVLLAANPDAPVVDVAIQADLSVRGLGLVGGTGTLTARAGASVSAKRVSVSGARQAGIAAFDAGTRLEVTRSVVEGPAADGCGWGIASWGADAKISDTAVTAARGAGIFADGGSLDIVGGSVVSTTPDLAGRFGRAIHAQYANVTVRWTYLSAATDASIFLLQPIAGDIKGVVIDLTAAGFSGLSPTGDAIVVSGLTSGNVKVRNNIVFDSSRASLVLEDAAVEVSGNSFSGAGIVPALGSDSLGQRRLRVGGVDAPSVLWLAPLDELAIDRDPMTCVY